MLMFFCIVLDIHIHCVFQADLLENILQNLVCALLRNFDVMFSLAFGVFLHLACAKVQPDTVHRSTMINHTVTKNSKNLRLLQPCSSESPF